MNPKVSIIMSVYNGSANLKESIESILSQSFRDFEFVIIDDASTDETPKILEQYQAIDTRIILVKNEHNIGLTKSLNKGIRVSHGDYIARMDAGDTSEPARFEKEVRFLDENPEDGLVGTWAYVIDENSKRIGVMEYATDYETLKRILIRYNPFVHSSIMMRRSTLIAAGLYDETWKYAQDYDLFFRMIRYGKCGLIGEHLVSYRLYSESITRKKNKAQTLFAMKARMRAIKAHQYSIWSYVFLLRPFVGYLLPYDLKRKVKSLIA